MLCSPESRVMYPELSRSEQHSMQERKGTIQHIPTYHWARDILARISLPGILTVGLRPAGGIREDPYLSRVIPAWDLESQYNLG